MCDDGALTEHFRAYSKGIRTGRGGWGEIKKGEKEREKGKGRGRKRGE